MLTFKEAVEKYVNTFNQVHTGLIEALSNAASVEEVTVYENEDDRPDSEFPMWGTMFSFGDSCDEHWLIEDNGIEIMSKLGFRIYDTDWGYFFGMDANCNLYEHFWKPLYENRGIHWHSAVLEKFQNAVDNCEYWDGLIERDGDKYYLAVTYDVEDYGADTVDIIRATTEIIEGKYVENILDELEGDFCKYDLDSFGESEANALRHAFFDNYLPALKKELGVK